MKRETAEWANKAEGDWRVALREFDSERPVYDAVCFHAQQAAEKYLKAWLIEKETIFPRTHDLVLLFDLTANQLTDLREEKAALAALTVYAVTFRYPGEEAVVEDGRESIDTAGRVRSALRRALSLET